MNKELVQGQRIQALARDDNIEPRKTMKTVLEILDRHNRIIIPRSEETEGGILHSIEEAGFSLESPCIF